MRHTQCALDRKTGLGREYITVRGLQIIDEDFVEEEGAWIDEAGVQVLSQLVGEAGD